MKRHLRETQKKLLAMIVDAGNAGVDSFAASAHGNAMKHLRAQKLIEMRRETCKWHATCAGIESNQTGTYEHRGQFLRASEPKKAQQSFHSFTIMPTNTSA